MASHADPSDSDDTYLPAGEELSSNSNLQNGLFNSLLTDDVKSGLAEPGLQPLCRLVVFANYLLMRVTLAVVTAKREEYGFDMFEALNTTGEPLTAIETFKPRVIQAEGLSDWKGSASKQWFDRVDAHLDREGGSSTDKRQSATSGVLIPFALRQSGKKIGKRLNEQRQYLKASYDDEANLEGKRQYVRTLAQVVAFMDGPWTNPREVEEIGNGTSDAQAAFGLAALRSGNHEIVVAPLARYHAAYRLASNEDNGRAAMAEEFVAACRTCAAFYALWRGSQVGTSRIDDVWRLAMQGQEGQIGQLARGKGGDLTVVPPVSEVQAYLRQKLDSRQLLDRDSWVRRASVMPIAQYTSLTRLLLFAASHDSVPDDSAPGLVVEGRAGIAPLLDVAHWTDEAMLTVEHIAPRNPSVELDTEWDKAIYEAPDTINTLGNLILLPRSANASISNRSWRAKRLLYQAYSSSTLDEADTLIEAARSGGLEIGDNSQAIVQNSRYLPLVKALAAREGAWDAAFITSRSERIASLAYDRFISWLAPM